MLHDRGIRIAFETSLHGLEVRAIEQPRESRGEDCLAYSGIGAGHHDVCQAAVTLESATAANNPAMWARVTFNVIDMRRRAVPFGTVGGRIPRTSKPRFRRLDADCIASKSSPMRIGMICEPLTGIP